MDDQSKLSNPFETWPLHVFRSPEAQKICRDDATLGERSPYRPAYCTPELTWTNFCANPAVRAAESGMLIQANGRPKLVLTYDLDVADHLRLRPGYRGRKERRGDPK